MSGLLSSLGSIQTSEIRTDYLIVGSGAGGSTAADYLSSYGKDVVILEEGGYFPTETFSEDTTLMMQRLYRNWGVSPILGRPIIAFAEGRCVGGTTVINGGLFWRTPDWILHDWKTRLGISGFSIEELRPHFEYLENALSVRLTDPEGSLNLDSQVLHRAAAKLGWKSVAVPRAVKQCQNLNLCATGCPSGAKQSMLRSLIPQSLSRGASLYYNAKVTKIFMKGCKAIGVQAFDKKGKSVFFRSDHVLLAGGALQTPYLIRKNRLSRVAGNHIQFHWNLKVVARFRSPLYAHKGTIFTSQVQQFERDGFLLMASNFRLPYLAMALSHLEDAVVKEAVDQFDHFAIYTAMVKPQSKGSILGCPPGAPLVGYRFESIDLHKVRFALEKTCVVLFEAGAEVVYLPFKKGGPFFSLKEATSRISTVKKTHLSLFSVHAMSSCSMGMRPEASVVDTSGVLHDTENVILCDASVVPTSIGESPQGTVMACARNILGQYLNG